MFADIGPLNQVEAHFSLYTIIKLLLQTFYDGCYILL